MFSEHSLPCPKLVYYACGLLFKFLFLDIIHCLALLVSTSSILCVMLQSLVSASVTLTQQLGRCIYVSTCYSVTKYLHVFCPN